MQATKNNVIIRPILGGDTGQEEFVTTGGIIIPTNVAEQKAEKARVPKALVMSIGPEVDEVSVGDEVIYNKFGAKNLGPGFEEYFSININEVLGIVS